jgi:predicted RNase H-like HicB family nuclease
MDSLESLLRRPWTIGAAQGDGEFVLSVAEMPEFFVAGRTPAEAEAEFWEALESHLASYVVMGQEPPGLGHDRPTPAIAEFSVSERRQRADEGPLFEPMAA